MKRATTHLRLFRSPGGDPPRYTGTLLVPGVPPIAYNVQAWVEDVDSGNGTGTRKCLCGFISGGQEVREPPKPKEKPEAKTPDLLAPLEEAPFNDSLDVPF